MMTEPTRPMGTLRLGFLLSSASGPVDSHPVEREDREHYAEEQVCRQAEVARVQRRQAEPAGSRRGEAAERQRHHDHDFDAAGDDQPSLGEHDPLVSEIDDQGQAGDHPDPPVDGDVVFGLDRWL